nr:MAG TPA: hypothetical protein [Caudoviricetes sp.]
MLWDYVAKGIDSLILYFLGLSTPQSIYQKSFLGLRTVQRC